MLQSDFRNINYPLNYPMNFSRKLSIKVRIKKEYVRQDGTSNVFVQVFVNKERVKLAANIAVRIDEFDDAKQRVKQTCLFANDYNLIIEKILSDINKIEIQYRLSNVVLTKKLLEQEYYNSTSRIDFIAFWKNEMEAQKEKLKPSTYRQQMAMLNKLIEYRPKVLFYELNDDFINEMRLWLRKVKKNEETTIASFMKSLKKYLHLANKRGIITPVNFTEIKVGSFKGKRTFLMPDEIQKFYKYWQNEFINATHKAILSRFLFSCFTGLRISDNLALSENNFMGEFIAFASVKTGKFQRIVLNKSAQQFLSENTLIGNFTPEYINRELKFIAKAVGIRKVITFHVARHTFATNYLLSGGRVENLQKILGHYKIEETMIYVHIVESITDAEIKSMDEILNIDAK